MEDIAISIAAKVVEYLVAPIVQPIARPFSYIWNYKTNFDNLKTEVRKLEGQKETVRISVDLAGRNGDQIKQHVSDWLDRVKTVTDEASQVIEQNERANMKCFKGLCPNPKKRYQHSRNAAKKAKAIVDLYAEGKFETVSFRTLPEEIWIPSHKGYEAFESRMSTFKDILDALSNPDVNMIGIYGAGGIGKTTLVRAIAEQVALDKKLFNVVASVVVAREGLTFHEIQKEIQQEIADKLGLTFHEESVTVRASRLQARLKQEEKVLLVLDNIWERLNLEDVGIPFGNDHKGCKLLLTARSLDVLSEMDSQCNFRIGVLDKGEAWSLFNKRAGACIENNDCLQALARKVAEACGGFPIAITSVAVALKNKEEFEWEDALEKLTTSSESNFEGVTEKTYSSIEISYSQLKEKQLKSTFLLCCKMEYTGLEALLEYGMGLGIFEDVNTMEKARNRVNTLVRKLNDSSLLLGINNSRFSLHDVVRYVGRSIASREGHKFTLAKNDIPREWVDEDILKNCVGISLYNISKLPEEFECPKLQFFYMSTVRDLWRVPDNFFAGMPKLKVLHLAGLKLHSVPNSIHHLVNLRTLYIYDCKLRDVDFIGEFKQLEILRIRGCYGSEIEMIPKQMCNLTGLRLLDLKDCSILRNIPLNVLSTFTQLEELYLSSSIKWEVEGVNIPSYKGYIDFESRRSTLKYVLDGLSNPNVNMVGIYGLGGIGKTMLAREIAGQAEDKKLFNVVAFAEVAEKPDIKEIQQEIADKLGLTLIEETLPGRARSLQQRLKQEEKVLLVLDNIWERLNLEDVGIPFGNDHKGCKLLLTARNLDVLSKMDSRMNFVVDFLCDQEAWSLFKKKAGSCDQLLPLAIEVVMACGGFPIAIDSVAVALKNKEEYEWRVALRELRRPSPINFEGVAAGTYSSIEISYSQLKERELKSTFLLCCIMEYSSLEALLEYGMGLGTFEDVESMEDARNRVNTLVRKLKDSSLLLDINNGTFSLHDVVRDVGRSIASRDGRMFTAANNYIPREWVDKDILKNCVGISLYNISKLPEEFECPELQFFYMSTARDLWRVPDNFFAGMPKLKVLHLAGLKLNSVPNSIRLLVNLRTLCIDDCQLRDVDFIGDIKQLEILRIRGYYCRFENVSILKKMCNLIGLRLLDLSECYGPRNIPPNVLSTFTRLEELYLPSSIELEVEGFNILDELKHLKHLTALKISIPDDSVLPKRRLVSNKLERYNIIIGNCQWDCFDHGQTSRMVQLNLETSSCCDDVQKFFSLLDREGFPELEYLHVENSPCFRTVVDCLESESCHHFLYLQSLSLHSVLNLEMIHNYPLKADSFCQLRTIKVQFCHKLKNILSFSTYRALPLLQEVDVSSCDNMEEIFAIRREEVINNDEGMNKIEFKQLRSLKLHSLPKLTSFCSFNNNKDMFDTPTLLFNQKITFPSLEEIKISKSNNSKILRSLFAI